VVMVPAIRNWRGSGFTVAIATCTLVHHTLVRPGGSLDGHERRGRYRRFAPQCDGVLLVPSGSRCDVRNPERYARIFGSRLARAVLDGEICGDTGSDGIQSVLEARGRRDAATTFLAFDVRKGSSRQDSGGDRVNGSTTWYSGRDFSEGQAAQLITFD
jgi:hypothetical protein